MPKKSEVAKKATFSTDDKRAQYARLVVFNYGVEKKFISKDKDVNTVSESDLQKAWSDLVGGTYLDGTTGIESITDYSKKGAMHEKVAKNGLTKAYAQEVRPFIKKGLLSSEFGRRGKKAAEKPAPKAKAATKASTKATAKKPAKAQTPAEAPSEQTEEQVAA